MDKDDYSLVNSNEISELKHDVDYMKRNPLGGTKAGKSLQESIDKLNSSVSELIEIFKEAHDIMKAEEREADVIVERIKPIEQQLTELTEQNQKIAQGILAVADMVQRRPEPKPMQQPIRKPTMAPRPGGMPKPMAAPRPMGQPNMPPSAGMPPTPGGLPPLAPPKKEEKKGILGMFKK